MNRPAIVSVLPVKEPAAAVRHNPVRLSPVAWGRSDFELARAVLANLIETTPATVIPANPVASGRLRAWLTAHQVQHFAGFMRSDESDAHPTT